MQTQLEHVQVNVSPSNLPFYKDLFSFMGWNTLYEDEGMLGMNGQNGVGLWFTAQPGGAANDYDGVGLNHFGVHTEKQEDVDAVAAYLREHGIDALFDTPRHRPDFARDENSTYYQVMFETPDRILVEIVYIGPKSA